MSIDKINDSDQKQSPHFSNKFFQTSYSYNTDNLRKVRKFISIDVNYLFVPASFHR
jgi:hypothetical protein